ncbi:MotA/TolQ/ExbB proton channel family protein [Olavius algarvensis spirochete endosymbiont]|uniref:MotA/TolQ/ExbB proton channel family protein n=1 Tax=Olavius algarvensis spirochete endosymbiont TaxID=260710 RepID=UPI00068E2189|nr:MotA/TolQ/ExbB proton channel family protein [Olavius algarvensis spirochete endosymbiont]VDA99831.1 MotA/TolQ/ExbB proton channel family protein [Olavius algarvensis spirochete endosymbiont]
MAELIRTNWLILTPIILLSVAALGIILERTVFYYRTRVKSQTVLREALSGIGKTPVDLILKTFPKRDLSLEKSLLAFALTTRIRLMPEVYKQRLEALREKYLGRMERNLPILNGIGNVATLMGLLGTVAGMITVFSRMNATGSSDPYVLAGGISQALVTTAAGLAVAIPAMLALHLFEAIVGRHSELLDEIVAECLSISSVRYAFKRESAK